jgi:hypothetical protein
MTNRKLSWLLAGLVCLNVAMPSGAAAQQKKEEEEADDLKGLLGAMFGPNFNVYLQGGFTTTGRLLLQHPIGNAIGEQSLQTNTGYNIGIGVGGDYFLRQGFRLSYVYSNNDLTYRTNNGDGSSNLDIDTNAKLHSNTVGVELIRYLLPYRASITPYGTIGLSGTWWGLDSSPLILASGGSTHFRGGGGFSFGLQSRPVDHFGVRLEAASYTIGNPFTGKNSFRSLGTVIDEPTNMDRWDYRLIGVYYFQTQHPVVKKKVVKDTPS